MTETTFKTFAATLLLPLSLAAYPGSLYAAALKSAEITEIVNQVNVVNSGEAPRSAKLNETISGKNSVQTGPKSLTELLFSDKTMARLGANSMFSFTNGTRDIDLQQGTMLLQVPKGAGGAKITTAAVTAAITGTTIMVEYFPGGYSKVIVLEGTLRLYLTNRVGESTLLGPGKMIILNPKATELPEPVNVDIKRLVKTSKLVQGIKGTDLDLKLVNQEIGNQDKEKKRGNLIGTNLVIAGSGTQVIVASDELLNTLQNASFEQDRLLSESAAGNPIVPPQPPAPPEPPLPPAPPTPPTPPDPPTPPTPPTPPNKYQSLVTITNPDPYLINATTSIVTDPTITTNGVKNDGTLYNSTVQTGNTSDFLFGSTSAFDTATGFNNSYLGADYSAFRFSNLEFAGNPSIVTAGGPNKLFLVSENNISTAAGSFSLSFPGLDFLGLATVNGYVSIGHGITGPTQLDLYARGTGLNSQGMVYLDAPVTLGTGSTLNAYGQTGVSVTSMLTADSIHITTAGDLAMGSQALKASEINLLADHGVIIQGTNFDTTNLISLTVQGNSISYSGNADLIGANASFIAGSYGFSAYSGSLLNIQTILSSGDIVFYSGNLSASGIVAASGVVKISGDVQAGSIGAFNDLTARSIVSASNINSTQGNVITLQGMTAAFNINAAGNISGGAITADTITAGRSITSSTTIHATGAISGTSIVAPQQIFAGSIIASRNLGDTSTSALEIAATSGDIFAGLYINAKSITSAGSIHSDTDIILNSEGMTSTNGTITAGSIRVMVPNNSVLASNGSIISDYLVGPDSAGTVTFQAANSILTTRFDNMTGTIVFRAPDISITDIAQGVAPTASQLDDSANRILQTLNLQSSAPVTISLDTDLGTAANPISSIIAGANVTFQSPIGEIYAGSIEAGSIIAGEIQTFTGSIVSANAIASSNYIVSAGAITAAGPISGTPIIAALDISGSSITSTSDILSSGGSITSGSTLTAATSITSAGTMTAIGAITADSLSAAGAISGGNLDINNDITSSAGSITSTLGDITSTSGTISAFGAVTSAAAINAGLGIQGDSLSSNGNITTGDAISVTNTITTFGDITVAKNGIFAGGNIDAHNIVVTQPNFEVESSTGSITGTFLIGPSTAGTTTYRAATSITANALSNAAGTVLLRASSITLASATSGDLAINSIQLDDPTNRLLQDLVIFTDGVQTLTVNLSGDVGTAANPIAHISSDTFVTWSGPSFNMYATNVGTGAINVGGLYSLNLNTGAGDLSAVTINRTQDRITDHSIAVGGFLTVSNGINFDGNSGASPEKGGILILSANEVTFGTGTHSVNQATANGGTSSGTSTGGDGGGYGITATGGDFVTNSGSNILAIGGSATSANGGAGGNISLATSTLLTDRNMTIGNTLDANGGNGIAGGAGGSINLNSNNIAFTASSLVNLSGGFATTGTGGSAGYLTVNSTGDNVALNVAPGSTFKALGGGSNSGTGGSGSQLQFTTNGANAPITLAGYFDSQGGATGLAGGTGGNGGYIAALTHGANSDITIASTATLSTIGGDSVNGDSFGGNGYIINLVADDGNVTVANGATLTATTGLNSGTTVAGGNGGTIIATAKKHVSIAGTLKASSNDVPGKRVSTGPGNITVTSNETDATKPGITVANSSQILALLNAANPPGAGGTIKFESAGGKISLDGTVQSDKGTIHVVNNGANGAVDILNSATLRADVVKAGAMGANGVLTINGGGTGGLNADSQIKLYGNSNTGTVRFTGGTVNLTAPSIVMSANTVQVDNGTHVNSGAVSAQVYANNRVWNPTQGGNGGTTGTWSTNPTNSGAPSAAPAF